MAILNYQDYQIYYEVHGEGKPLVILNGIMMSTASWQPFVQSFCQYHQVILFDMLDQGKSSKCVNQEYDLSIQVQVLKAVIEHLSLEKINLMGISYGGEVAMHYAIEFPESIDKLLLFNTTAKTSPWLQEIGHAWNKASDDALAYYSTTIPTIYSPQFFSKNIEWIEKRKQFLLPIFANKEFTNAMVRLTNSAQFHDVESKLSKLTMPTLVVGCENDYITPLDEQRRLVELIPNAEMIVISDSGHASMYEKPRLFTALVLGFVLADHITFSTQ